MKSRKSLKWYVWTFCMAYFKWKSQKPSKVKKRNQRENVDIWAFFSVVDFVLDLEEGGEQKYGKFSQIGNGFE